MTFKNPVTSVEGNWFAAKSSQHVKSVAKISKDGLQIVGLDGKSLSYSSYDQITVLPYIIGSVRSINMHDGSVFMTLDSDSLDTTLSATTKGPQKPLGIEPSPMGWKNAVLILGFAIIAFYFNSIFRK